MAEVVVAIAAFAAVWVPLYLLSKQWLKSEPQEVCAMCGAETDGRVCPDCHADGTW